MLRPDDDRAADVSLCVFPHTGQTVIVDTRPGPDRARVIAVAAAEVFSEAFYSSVEQAFRDALRNDERPILNLITLPQKVEEMLRERTVRAILDTVGDSGDTTAADGAPSIAVLFFGGPIIDVDAEHLKTAIRSLFERQLNSRQLTDCVEQVTDFALREQAAAGVSPRSNLEGLIRGDAGGYATLWQASDGPGNA